MNTTIILRAPPGTQEYHVWLVLPQTQPERRIHWRLLGTWTTHPTWAQVVAAMQTPLHIHACGD